MILLGNVQDNEYHKSHIVLKVNCEWKSSRVKDTNPREVPLQINPAVVIYSDSKSVHFILFSAKIMDTKLIQLKTFELCDTGRTHYIT